MFNDDEPPVSLFSFQDIITSLTGIMIFFLLLLSLIIMELTQKTRDASPVARELEQVRMKNDVLKKQISEMASDIRDYRKRIRIAQSRDESALILERYRLEKQLAELKSQKDSLDRELKKNQEKYAASEKLNQKLRQQQKELEQKKRQSREMAAKIRRKNRPRKPAGRSKSAAGKFRSPSIHPSIRSPSSSTAPRTKSTSSIRRRKRARSFSASPRSCPPS